MKALIALLLCAGLYLDVHAAPPRSAAARRQFLKEQGYPNGRPGYVVDHIVPLACGGLDVPANMQLQTIADAKAKDTWERTDCQPKRATALPHRPRAARRH